MPTPSPGPDFNDLLEKARGGSTDALGELLIRSLPDLQHGARFRKHVQMQSKPVGGSDLVQDTLADALLAFASFRGTTEQELLAWMGSLLRNNYRKQVRSFYTTKRNVAQEVSLNGADPRAAATEVPDKGPGPLVALLREEVKNHLRKAIRDLPETERRLILGHFYDEKSLRRLAAEEGCSVTTMCNRLTRTLCQLHAFLPGERRHGAARAL